MEEFNDKEPVPIMDVDVDINPEVDIVASYVPVELFNNDVPFDTSDVSKLYLCMKVLSLIPVETLILFDDDDVPYPFAAAKLIVYEVLAVSPVIV